MRELGVSGSLHQALHAFAEPEAVIGDIKQVIVRRRIDGEIGGRHVVNRVIREELQPFRQSPFVEQFGFGEQEILDVGASNRMHGQFNLAHAGTRKTCSFQFDQNARIWASSS